MVARAPGSSTETGLTSDQQARVDAALDALLDLPPRTRESRLDALRADDPAVGAEVASLLEAADACGDFLSRPAAPASHVVVAPGLDAGARIGAWRVVREIGYGGMGEVYEAERVEGGFAQRAALKLLRREARDQLGRFHAERQILARLEHRNIARLLDGGVAPDGRPYMAMELVEGASLMAHCEAKRTTLDERLALFVQVCDAVA
ncbi:MAG: protein kinase, partial [Caldimonas sp.]